MQLHNFTLFSHFSFDKRKILLLMVLALLPNLFGFFSLPTVFGFRLHVFQYFIFLAGLIFGPFGGIVAGGLGSAYTAFLLGNPYILLGNILLGAIFGFLVKHNFSVIKAGLLAFIVQAPFLYYTDVFLAGMPYQIVVNIIVALFFGNLLWLFLAKRSYTFFQGNPTQTL